METFRKLTKDDLHEIISVAKASYESRFFEGYVLSDILSAFDKNQRYKLELYGYFRGNKLVHFGGFAKSIGIGNCYELRLSTTLPEFRRMGYAFRSFERRVAKISARHRNEKLMIQASTRNPKIYLDAGFVESDFKTNQGFIYLYKIIKR